MEMMKRKPSKSSRNLGLSWQWAVIVCRKSVPSSFSSVDSHITFRRTKNSSRNRIYVPYCAGFILPEMWTFFELTRLKNTWKLCWRGLGWIFPDDGAILIYLHNRLFERDEQALSLPASIVKRKRILQKLAIFLSRLGLAKKDLRIPSSSPSAATGNCWYLASMMAAGNVLHTKRKFLWRAVMHERCVVVVTTWPELLALVEGIKR